MKRGVALVTAMIVLLFLLAVGSVVLFLAIRNMQILGSGRRVQNTREAAEAGVEASLNSIQQLTTEAGINLEQQYKFGKYKVDVEIVPFYNEFVVGSGVEFSTGYEPIGTETSGGGMSKIYIIYSSAKGPRKEKKNLQVLYRKIVGLPGK
ncbi:MAG: hypothetical protein DRQ10_00380 [Candidatus Hydrothermota bacterium]|nr:MAG: hypothetical protein DRQ10_00380 [Candidatus Hydrothermae bacterium]